MAEAQIKIINRALAERGYPAVKHNSAIAKICAATTRFIPLADLLVNKEPVIARAGTESHFVCQFSQFFCDEIYQYKTLDLTPEGQQICGPWVSSKELAYELFCAIYASHQFAFCEEFVYVHYIQDYMIEQAKKQEAQAVAQATEDKKNASNTTKVNNNKKKQVNNLCMFICEKTNIELKINKTQGLMPFSVIFKENDVIPTDYYCYHSSDNAIIAYSRSKIIPDLLVNFIKGAIPSLKNKVVVICKPSEIKNYPRLKVAYLEVTKGKIENTSGKKLNTDKIQKKVKAEKQEIKEKQKHGKPKLNNASTTRLPKSNMGTGSNTKSGQVRELKVKLAKAKIPVKSTIIKKARPKSILPKKRKMVVTNRVTGETVTSEPYGPGDECHIKIPMNGPPLTPVVKPARAKRPRVSSKNKQNADLKTSVGVPAIDLNCCQPPYSGAELEILLEGSVQ